MGRKTNVSDVREPQDAVARIKADLADHIMAIVDRLGLTVREAQALTGQAAADFSRLRSGHLQRFTLERLLKIASRLGEPVALSLVLSHSSRSPVTPPFFVGHMRALRAICRRYSVTRLAAFGSVLREDFDPERSDIDLVVDFDPSTLFGPADQFFGFKSALEGLFGRSVDLVESGAISALRLKRIIERTRAPLFEKAA